jgi:phage major head subunit gpT-like protein
MAIPLTLREFDELAEPILNEVFFAGYERALNQGMSVKQLFGVRSSSKRYEYTLSRGGVSRYDEREEGGPVNMDVMEQLFKTTFEMVEYNKTVPIDKNMIADQDYMQVQDIVDALGMGAAQTQLYHAASVFNNAFDSSYTGGDSKVLCAADHPLDKDGDNEGDNAGSTALSYDAVVDTITEMMKFKDARNEPISVVPDTLIVPVALWETGMQIVRNVNEPETADRNINAVLQKGPFQLIADPRLDASDTNNWFLVDSVLAQRQLIWFDREPLNFAVDTPSATDKNYYVGASMRYDYGWSDWRFIYGHSVS